MVEVVVLPSGIHFGDALPDFLVYDLDGDHSFFAAGHVWLSLFHEEETNALGFSGG